MPTAPTSPLRKIRILVAALMGSLLVIGLALSFTIGGHRTDNHGNAVHTHAPGVWMYVVILALGFVAAGLAQTFGYRIPALAPGHTPTQATVLQLYQRSMFLRFALSEAVAIVAIALLFAGPSNTILPYVMAAGIAELLMAYHVWPSQRLISRVQRGLDRNGGQSDLANALNAASSAA